MSIQIPVHVRNAVRNTWDRIGPDAEASGFTDPAEACVNTGSIDDEEARTTISELIKQHGYDPVMRALADKCF